MHERVSVGDSHRLSCRRLGQRLRRMAASPRSALDEAEAQAAGRERAKQEKTEHIVHDADGTIEQRTSYRNRTDSSTGERDE